MTDGPGFERQTLDSPSLPPPPGERSGPPWEGPGEFFPRYIETVRLALTDPRRFFATMRLEGGLQAPVIFAVIGMVIGAVAGAIYSWMGPAGPFGMGWPAGDASAGAGFVAILLLGLGLGILGLFIGAGIFHLMLSLLGAVRQPFEATLRVVAYAGGATALMQLVPFCGGIVGALYALVLYVVGLQQVHECDTPKALIAVLAPSVACCVVLALMWGAVMALIFGAAAVGAMGR